MSLILACIVLLYLYFFPTIMAIYYKNNSAVIVLIGAINLFFGWFGLGWIIAMIMACVYNGLFKSIKSILFCLFVLIMCSIFIVAELTAILIKMGIIQ